MTAHGDWGNGATSRVLVDGAGTSWSIAAVTTPDGRVAIWGVSHGTVRRFDPDGGEIGSPVTITPPQELRQPVFLDRQQTVMVPTSGLDDGTSRGVQFLDAQTGAFVAPYLSENFGEPVTLVPFTLPDGRSLVVLVHGGFRGSYMHLLDPVHRADVGQAAEYPRLTWPPSVYIAAAEPVLLDQHLHIVVCTNVGTLGLWDAGAVVADNGAWAGHGQQTRLPFDRAAGAAVVSLPDGRTAVAVGGGMYAGSPGGLTELLGVFDVRTQQALLPPITLPAAVHRVVALPRPDGRDLIAVSDDGGTVRLYAPDTLTPVGPPLAAGVATMAPFRAGGGRILLATAADENITVWEPVPTPPSSTSIATHAGAVNALAALPTVLFSAGADKTVHRVDPTTGAPAGAPLTGHTGQVFALTLAGTTPPLLISASADGTLRRFDAATGAPVGAALPGHTGPVRAVASAVRPDGTALVVSAGSDGTVRRWDAGTGVQTGPALTGHVGPVYAVTTVVAALPGGPATLIATGGDDTTVRLWDAATGQPAGAPLTGPTGPVRALVAIEVAGVPLLAGAGDDRTIRLWNPATGQAVGAPLTGHTGPVRALAVLPRPDGPALLASAGDDDSLRLWDPATGHPVGGPLITHTDTVRAVTPVPIDGDVRLATAGDDATIAVWTIP